MNADNITGISLAMVGLIYLCRRNWIDRLIGVLFSVAGISQIGKQGVALGMFLFIPVVTTVWILQATDKSSKESHPK
jgi:hypothetical protein